MLISDKNIHYDAYRFMLFAPLMSQLYSFQLLVTYAPQIHFNMNA